MIRIVVENIFFFMLPTFFYSRGSRSRKTNGAGLSESFVGRHCCVSSPPERR